MAEKVKLNISVHEEIELLDTLVSKRKVAPKLGDTVVLLYKDRIEVGVVQSYPKANDSTRIVPISLGLGVITFKHQRIIMAVEEYNELVERDYPEYLI